MALLSLSTWTTVSTLTLSLYFLYTRLSTSKNPLFRHDRDIKPDDPRPWAFITASSSGIGYGIAHSLLTHNFNMVLHGRDPTRLRKAVEMLRTDFPDREIQSIRFDVTDSLTANGTLSSEVLQALSPLLNPSGSRKINLRLLVNNVGIGFDPNSDEDFAAFTAQTLEHVSRNIDVNIRFTTYLTHLLLPVLCRNALNDDSDAGRVGQTHSKPASTSNSMILNISSLATIGIPHYSVYSGSKAYLTTFSKALATELRAENWPVDVKVMELGDVDTPGHRVPRNLFTPSADAMGRMVVESLMDQRSGVLVFPFWSHWVQHVACVVQPFWLLQMGLIANLKQRMAERTRVRGQSEVG